jgi:signal transduction histidine kinase/CHASE2 domain-containing sensor protein
MLSSVRDKWFDSRPFFPAKRRVSGNPHSATRGMMLGLIVSLATLLLLSNHHAGQGLENDTLDFWFGLRNVTSPDMQPSQHVAVVAVDEATLRRWRGRVFDAHDVGRLLRLLQNQQVAATVLTWPALTDDKLNLPGEVRLTEDITGSGIACLPLNFVPTTDRIQKGTARLRSVVERFAVEVPPTAAARARAAANGLTSRLEAPPLPFLQGAAGAGHIAFTLDGDGRVRRLPLLIEYGRRLYPPLSLAAARIAALRRDKTAGTRVPGLPLLPDGAMLLNFPGGSVDYFTGPHNDIQAPFRTISLAAALDDPQLLRDLRGYCVVIGPTAAGMAPMFSTPTGARLPVTVLHAVAIDNILSEQSIERAPALFTWLLTILLCVTVGGFVMSRPPLWSGVVVLLSLTSVAALSLGLFAQNIWLDISLPWLASGLTFLGGVISRARRQERESTRIASTIDALGRVSEIIATQAQSEQLLYRVLGWATSVMGAQGALALLLDESGQTLHLAAATRPKSQALEPFTLQVGEGIAGWVAQHGQPVVVNDVRSDPRFKKSLADAVDFPTYAILCVPLRVRDKMMGVIEVVNRLDGSPFNEDDEELLSAVANQAALVLENSRLYEILSERVVQSESDLEKTNRRLQAEKNTLQTVLQSMTDGVVVTDSAGIVHLVNPAAVALLPELGDDAVGRPLTQLLPDVAQSAADLLEHCGAREHNGSSHNGAPGNKDGKYLVQLQRGDIDTPRYIEAHSAPLQGEDGVLAGIVSVFADVTEERGIEQAKSDFVSFVAHEMRSPLTSISGFSAMLQKQEQNAASKMGDGKTTPTSGAALPATSGATSGTTRSAPGASTQQAARARFLAIIHNESERLTRLINNLLDVARIEAGRGIELHPESTDITATAEEAVESQRAYSSRHQLIVSIPPDLPPALADRDKVVQILINLISNALKYSPGGTVTVAAHADEQSIFISVRDEGPGIAPEQRARLFKRFERTPSRSVGSGERAKPTGTGLGLFLTRHLVESHDGRIWVESEPGQGATFIFTLPRA